MQENHVNQPPSLSQLLRESYLAEARAQQRHSDMSRSDCSSSRRLVYGPLKGKAEESVGREDAPFPDLSAFLSQEELDESVNLACQAIGHKSHEERAEFKAIITPSNTPTATLPSTPSAKISDTPCVTPSVPSITNTPSVTPPVPCFNNTPCDTPAVPSFISTPSATPMATSYTNTPSATPYTNTPSVPPSVPSFTNTLSATSLANPVTAPSIQSAPEKREGPPAIATFTAERQLHQPYMQDAVVRSNRASKEAPEEPNRPGRNTPFGPETQSKKEFLNKAADFIEELSSLFKANSTKRVRPRACKAHRSRSQNKSQPDGTAYSLNPEDRERPVLPLEADRTPSKPCNQPEAQAGSEHGHVDPAVEDSEVAEEQCDSAPPEVEEADSPAPVETPYSADPICEPPHFIQKLKSREVAEGSKVQLDCIVRGAPVPEVRWFCEGKELENSPDIQILTDGELHSLIIAEAFEEDTGRYSCFASNFYGTDSTSAEIYIEGASSTDSEGEHHLEHVTQSHNASAQPSISAASLASPVAPSEEAGGSPTAFAPVFHEEHPGEEFSRAPGQVTTAAPPPPAADAALPAPEVSVAAASIEAFEVEEESAPSPAEALSPVTPVVAQSVAHQEVSPQLSPTLPPVQTVTTVPLTTVVTSALPSQLTSTHVAEIQNYSDSYPQGLDGRPIMAAPVFTKSLQEVLASEGQLVVLECRVKGVPSPKVFWYREGTIIEDSPDFRILQKKPRPMTESEEICTLVIAEVFPEDSGMFTCTASNKYGTVSCIAALRVKGNGNNINHAKAPGNFTMEFSQVPEPSPSDFRPSSLKPQAEASATNSIKPHSSTLRLDPLNSSTLRLDPLSTSTLRVDSISSTMLRPDLLSASLPNLDPVTLHSARLESRSASTARLDPMFLSTLHQDLPGSGTTPRETQSSSEVPLYLKPFSDPTVARPQSASLTTIQEDGRPFPNFSEPAKGGILRSEASPNHKNKTSSVVPLADPPTASCLKSGVLVNHNEPRSSSRVGLRVHFRLPEDEEDEGDVHGDQSNEDWALSSANKEPPPVFAKPKLDPVQLQLLHNQVLMEQQQDTEPNSQNLSEASPWPRKTHHESPPHPAPLQPPAPALPRSPHPPASLSTAPAAILNSAPVARGNAPPAFLLTTTTSTPLAHPTAAPIAYTTSTPIAYTTSSAPVAYTTSTPIAYTTSSAPVAYTTSTPMAYTTSSAPVAYTTSTPMAYTTSSAPVAYTTSTPMAYTTSSAPVAYTTSTPMAYTTSSAPVAYTTSTPMAYTTSSAPVAYTTSTPMAYTTSSAPVAYTTSTPMAYTTSSAPVAYTTSAPFPYTTNSAPIAYTTTLTPFPHTTSTPLANTASAVTAHPTVAPFQYTAPGHPTSTLPSPPQLKTVPTPLVTSPPPAPQLSTTPAQPLNPAHAAPFSMAPVSQMNTIHASYLNLSPLSLGKTQPILQFNALPAPHLSSAPAALISAVPATLSKASPSLECTSPSPMLRTTHASLMNLAPISQSFNYARPKEFIAAQSLSPIRSPSPTESPVPLLHELAAELQSSSSSPTVFPFSPPPRFFPTRVLTSPTSPPGSVPSPTQVPYLNALFAPQSPPQSPTSSSSTPSPIQNPVAFLSSVLPCLPTSQPTNSMGLPRSAPVGHSQGALKKLPRSNRSLSDDNIRDNKDSLIHDIEKKFRFRDDTKSFGQQKLTYEGNTASRALGPHIPATVFNYDEEYRVSNFEQRLMSEIEFRLERTPVEESDDDVHHDEIPTGKCIAPIFDKKLKNFRAMEGVPVTFTCKVVGIPIPKVYWFKDGKQILRKNDHYKKIREGDGTCALHIERTTNDDDGNYTVMAANPQGRISCSGHLIIQTGPTRNRMTPIHSQRVRARVQEVEEGEQTQERFFQPHFLQAPGDMKAHEGGLCRLDCKVSGLPNPELMWLVNGRPIYPDFHHRMLVRENGIHSLVIDPLKQTDDGTYTCIASNKAGQSSFCLELRVVEKELKQAPHLVEKLQNTGVAEGSPVRLECRVVGMPPPVIFWKKDNDSIPHTKDRVSMHSDATGYVCLVIQPTKKEDAGWYTVSAKNEAGIVSCTSRLDIYAQWHQHIPSPMKKAPRTGSRYAALTGQGLDIKSAFPMADNTPTLFSSSPAEAKLESEEL